LCVTDLELNHLDTFCINSKINSWITVAVIIKGLIFAGGNEGSIYLYKLNHPVNFPTINSIQIEYQCYVLIIQSVIHMNSIFGFELNC